MPPHAASEDEEDDGGALHLSEDEEEEEEGRGRVAALPSPQPHAQQQQQQEDDDAHTDDDDDYQDAEDGEEEDDPELARALSHIRRNQQQQSSSSSQVAITAVPTSASSSSASASASPTQHTRGKLLRMELTDFLCHKRLRVEFSPGINFITGPNGSGKSAIVAALQVALGLKASSTGRADKLSELIRRGSDGPAIVRVWVQNDPLDGFMYRELGDVILVERTLNRSGASPCKLINCRTNKTVCTAVKDVQRLCDEFMLFVDNPCCVMDQDEVKVFLRGTAEQKYHFFLKATNLEAIGDTYAREKDSRNAIKHEYEAKQAMLGQLKKRRDVAQKEYDALVLLRSTSEDLGRIKRELLWASVGEFAQRTAELASAVHLAEEESSQAKRAVDELEGQASSAEGRMQALQDRIDEVNADSKQKAEAVQQAKKDLMRAQRPLNEQRAQCDGKRSELDLARARLDAKQNELAGIVRSQGGDAVAQLSDKLASHQAALQRMEQAEEQSQNSDTQSDLNIDYLLQRQQQLELQLQECAQQCDQSASTARQAEQDFARVDRQLKDLASAASASSSSASSSLSRFHTWLPRLMDLVQRNQSRFKRHLPVFVGEHVKLVNSKYLRPVETTLYTTLQSFVCDCIEDERVLRQLAVEQARVPSNELVVNVRAFSQQRHPVQQLASQLTSFASVLDVSNVNAFNTLVDANRIEKLVLVDSRDEGNAMFQGPASNSSLPQGVISCIDLDGNSFSVRGGSRVFESANPQHQNRPMRLLTGESAEAANAALQTQLSRQHADLKQRSDHARHEAQSHHAAKQTMQRELDQVKRDSGDFDRKMRARQEAKTRLQRECDQVQAEIETLAQQTSNAKLNKVRAQVETLQQQVREAKEELDSLQEDAQREEQAVLPPLHLAVTQCERAAQQAKLAIAQAKSEFEAFNDEYEPHSNAKQHTQARAAHAHAALAQARTTHAQAASRLEDMRASTLEQCDGQELTPSRSRKDLQVQYAGLQRAMENEAKRSAKGGETPQARLIRVECAKERAEKNYGNLSGDLRVMEKRLKRAKNIMKLRQERYAHFQEWAETSTKDMFSELLRQKGNDGDVHFDHKTKALEIEWHRTALAAGTSTQADDDEDEKPGGGGVSDAKSLSGGERSMTTLALLLAMGRNVAAPFRVMDEFDVFMDAVTRKIAIDQLIVDARQPVGGLCKQCIFLTPLDISEIPDAPDLKKLIVSPSPDTYGTAGRGGGGGDSKRVRTTAAATE